MNKRTCQVEKNLTELERLHKEAELTYKKMLEDKLDSNQEIQAELSIYLKEKYPQFEELRQSVIQMGSQSDYESLYEFLEHVMDRLEMIDYEDIDLIDELGEEED